MQPILNVFALPKLFDPDEVAAGTVVVIDVLRASTTIAYALEAGATEVVPCEEVDEARGTAAQFRADDAILGGERLGVPIDGFDLGNSPAEYTPAQVGEKAVVYTTTNGTKALARCRKAARILIGAFVNASAVCEAIGGDERVYLVCAGTRGQFTEEDTLLAGLIVDRLVRRGEHPYKLNAQAVTARENWLAAFALPYAIGAEPLEPERLAEKLRESLGGRNLTAIGLEADILAAAQIDRFSRVPRVDPETFHIRLT